MNDAKSPPAILRTWPWSKIKNQDSLRAVKERYYSSTPEAIFWFRIQNDEIVKKHWHEMTQEEKEHVPPPPGPPRRMYVTQQHLDSWLDPKKYGLWIDNKKVSNEVLRNYSPEDFGHYSISRLYPNAKNYGRHQYQLDLTTLTKFLTWRKETLERLGLDEKQ